MQFSIVPHKPFTLAPPSAESPQPLWNTPDAACFFAGDWGRMEGAEYTINGFTISYYAGTIKHNHSVILSQRTPFTAIQMLIAGTDLHMGTIQLQAHQPALVRLAGPHQLQLLPGSYECYNLHMGPSLFRKLAASRAGEERFEAPCLYLPVNVRESRMLSRFQKIIALLRQAPVPALDTYYTCLDIVKHFFLLRQKMLGQEKWLVKKAARLNDLETYITEHAGFITTRVAADLLHRYGLSSYQFNRMVRSTFNSSYAGLVRRAKMSLALKLLTTTDQPIGAIAESLGYADFSSFSRALKKFYGNSPGWFRNHKPA